MMANNTALVDQLDSLQLHSDAGLRAGLLQLPQEIRDMIYNDLIHPACCTQSHPDIRAMSLVNWQMRNEVYHFLVKEFVFILFAARVKTGLIKILKSLFKDDQVATGTSQARYASFPGYVLRIAILDEDLDDRCEADLTMMLIDDLGSKKLRRLLACIGTAKTNDIRPATKPFRKHKVIVTLDHMTGDEHLDRKKEEYIVNHIQALWNGFKSASVRGTLESVTAADVERDLCSRLTESSQQFLELLNMCHRHGLQQLVSGDAAMAASTWQFGLLQCRLMMQTEQFQGWLLEDTSQNTFGTKINNFLFTMCYKLVDYFIKQALSGNNTKRKVQASAVTVAETALTWDVARITNTFEPRMQMLFRLYAFGAMSSIMLNDFSTAKSLCCEALKATAGNIRVLREMFGAIDEGTADHALLVRWHSML